MVEDDARTAFIEFCKSPYAENLDPVELRSLSEIRWRTPPAAGTFKAMAAAIYSTLTEEEKIDT